MTSKERLLSALNFVEPDKVPVDFGGTGQTGIHVQVVAQLREYFGLEKKPVKVTEPFQMLGEIEEDLLDVLGGDLIPLEDRYNMFGIAQEDWHEFKTFWGQTVLLAGGLKEIYDEKGNLLAYPQGDISAAPTAMMPKSSYFFDAIPRNLPVDDSTLKVEDNLEEFGPVSEEDLQYWKGLADRFEGNKRALTASFGGTALGDVALVPAIQLKVPKGVRDVDEWYMSTMMRPDFMKKLFDRQTDLAIGNLEKIHAVVGNRIDVAFLCGTDFGTQVSTFCDVDTYRDIWMPYYRKVADWVHSHTTWKLFKHCCGAVESLIESFIDSGIDILNPVQISATGMDPVLLRKKYGGRIVFWGGGVDTQQVLSYGSPEEVEKQVLYNLEIFGKGGGYVFNTVHNTQANTPIPNFIAMLNAVKKFNGDPLV
jgi:hypothetical protein